MVQKYALDQIADDRLSLYVIWLPFHDTDLRARAQQATAFLPDARARHFWSSTLSLPEAYKVKLNLQKSPAWDVFLVFPIGAPWADPVPAPSFLMHNLMELPDSERLDGLRLARELAKMLP